MIYKKLNFGEEYTPLQRPQVKVKVKVKVKGGFQTCGVFPCHQNCGKTSELLKDSRESPNLKSLQNVDAFPSLAHGLN